MANCINCAAPLPPHSIVCAYCGARNDRDLKGYQTRNLDPETVLVCPRCDRTLSDICLKVGQNFYLNRCESCMGLFFDPGELDALLDETVTHVFTIDYNKIEHLATLKNHEEYGVSYIKCPVCRQIMNRVNFGARSGIIVDQCRTHGIWLDGGELRDLMEWVKAGGKLLQQEKEEYTRKEAEKKAKKEALRRQMDLNSYDSGFDLFGQARGRHELDLLHIIKKVAFKLLS